MRALSFDPRRPFRSASEIASNRFAAMCAATMSLPAWAGHSGEGFLAMVVVTALIFITFPALLLSVALASGGMRRKSVFVMMSAIFFVVSVVIARGEPLQSGATFVMLEVLYLPCFALAALFSPERHRQPAATDLPSFLDAKSTLPITPGEIGLFPNCDAELPVEAPVCGTCSAQFKSGAGWALLRQTLAHETTRPLAPKVGDV